jgi:hypothetical protein
MKSNKLLNGGTFWVIDLGNIARRKRMKSNKLLNGGTFAVRGPQQSSL